MKVDEGYQGSDNGTAELRPMAGRSGFTTTVLRCDICGAVEGRRHRPFKTARDLATHRTRAHGKTPAVETNGSHGLAQTSVPKSNAPSMSRVNFCPHCGCNLEVVNAALAFLEGEPRR